MRHNINTFPSPPPTTNKKKTKNRIHGGMKDEGRKIDRERLSISISISLSFKIKVKAKNMHISTNPFFFPCNHTNTHAFCFYLKIK